MAPTHLSLKEIPESLHDSLILPPSPRSSDLASRICLRAMETVVRLVTTHKMRVGDQGWVKGRKLLRLAFQVLLGPV